MIPNANGYNKKAGEGDRVSREEGWTINSHLVQRAGGGKENAIEPCRKSKTDNHRSMCKQINKLRRLKSALDAPRYEIVYSESN